MRILVTDGMAKQAMAKLRELGHEVVEQFYAPDALGAALREFDVLHALCLRTGPAHCGMTLGEGRFAVFFPGELHKPSCKTPGCDHVRKAAVKILMR